LQPGAKFILSPNKERRTSKYLRLSENTPHRRNLARPHGSSRNDAGQFWGPAGETTRGFQTPEGPLILT